MPDQPPAAPAAGTPTMIEITGVWPVPEVFRPIRRWDGLGWLRWLPEVVRLAFPVTLVILIANLTGDRDLTFQVAGLSAAFWIVRLLAGRIVFWAEVRAWRKAPGWNLPNTWWFDDKGFTISDGSFVQFVRWGACMELYVDHDRLVFMTTPAHGHVLPIRFLDVGTKQLDQIVGLVSRVRSEGRLGRGVD
jgi:hypothetical protein